MLEIVQPTEEAYEKQTTAAKLLTKKGGDCGYMAILQVTKHMHTTTSFKSVSSGGRPGKGLIVACGAGGAAGVDARVQDLPPGRRGGLFAALAVPAGDQCRGGVRVRE